MLSQSDTPIDQAIRFFSGYGRSASYFVPTETGLGKAIVDATDSLRNFFQAELIHDYAKQSQGNEGKELHPINIITPQGPLETQISFYRPKTKKGDPRFWIYGDKSTGWSLPTFVKPRNLLALFVIEGKLYLLNMSDVDLIRDASRSGSVLGALLGKDTDYLDPVAFELLEKMRTLRARGFIPSMKAGDTGVGFTLETLLGIKANAKKTPDFKGIELKSGRSKKNRATLFSKTPDWKISPFSAMDIVNRFGYVDPLGRRSYYNTLKDHPNSQGLYLFVPAEEQSIEGRALSNMKDELVTVWPL